MPLSKPCHVQLDCSTVMNIIKVHIGMLYLHTVPAILAAGTEHRYLAIFSELVLLNKIIKITAEDIIFSYCCLPICK